MQASHTRTSDIQLRSGTGRRPREQELQTERPQALQWCRLVSTGSVIGNWELPPGPAAAAKASSSVPKIRLHIAQLGESASDTQ